MPRARFTGTSPHPLTPHERDRFGYCGHALAAAISEAARLVKPGVTPIEIAKRVGGSLRALGVDPILERIALGAAPQFAHAASISVNDIAVNGVPNERPLVVGDVITIDAAGSFEGCVTDAATSMVVGGGDARLVHGAREVLLACLEVVAPGEPLFSIAQAARRHARELGLVLADEVIAHGVGRSLHEPPAVFVNHVEPEPSGRLVSGMVLAIEPVVVDAPGRGGAAVACETQGDGWSRKVPGASAFEERTIVVTENGFDLLTPIASPGPFAA